MEIIIFGAPGVGKGTQAKIISQKLNIPHISTGDILREAIKNETDLGKKAKEIVQKGDLVPDDIMGGLIKDTLLSDECKNGFILDGFPRTLPQAEILTNIFNELGLENPVVIKLSTDDDVIIKRLSSRRVCSNCGYITNLNELENPDVCPNCGARDTLYQRDDDKEEVIKNRLKIFHESTAPVIEYYKGKAKILEIDGALPLEEVTQQILQGLGID
jgi:adenylate kinase